MTTVMKKLLINSKLVNEGEVKEVDVLIEGERIMQIDSGIAASLANEVIDKVGVSSLRNCSTFPFPY